MDIEKQGELLETPITVGEDNQQPSSDSNILEGSTTNIQILSSKVEDSNDNTSALPISYKPEGIWNNLNKTYGDDIV